MICPLQVFSLNLFEQVPVLLALHASRLAGNIQGAAKDDRGNPIPGATVTYRRLAKLTGSAGRAASPRGSFANYALYKPIAKGHD
jgi:hypothetical protein